MVESICKECPRCGAKFSCQRGAITRCQCQGVTLNSAQRAYLMGRYDGCLCAKCLAALGAEYYECEGK